MATTKINFIFSEILFQNFICQRTLLKGREQTDKMNSWILQKHYSAVCFVLHYTFYSFNLFTHTHTQSLSLSLSLPKHTHIYSLRLICCSIRHVWIMPNSTLAFSHWRPFNYLLFYYNFCNGNLGFNEQGLLHAWFCSPFLWIWLQIITFPF